MDRTSEPFGRGVFLLVVNNEQHLTRVITMTTYNLQRKALPPETYTNALGARPVHRSQVRRMTQLQEPSRRVA